MRLDDVVEKYNAAARHYDRLMDLVFGAVLDVERQRGRLIELLGDLKGATVLDVGCGTGRNFPLLQAAVGEGGRIIGLDCSAGMLDQARLRIERHGWRNVELVQGDAVKLDGIEGPVDAVVSAWCYGTVYDVEGAMNRAMDVLRPGGCLGLVTFQRAAPERGPLRWLYPFYRLVVRCAGIDPDKDLDTATLQEKWLRGRQVLLARSTDLHEERYLHGAGLIVTARKPLAQSVMLAGSAPVRAAAATGRCSPARMEERAAMP